MHNSCSLRCKGAGALRAGWLTQTLSEARARDPRLRAFRTHPDEGRIESFETRIFTVGFDPKLWEDEKAGRRATLKEDFLLFLRVMRVQCMDFERSDSGYVDIPSRPRSVSEDFGWRMTDVEEERADPFTTGEASELRRRELMAARSSAVRLCLHGEALPVALSVRPNTLQLGRVALGATQQRVLRLTNDCTRLPLLFRVARPPPPGVRVRPTDGALKPGGSLEMVVCVTPVSFGTCRTRLRLELLSASRPLLGPEERALLGSRVVRIVYECPAELPPPPLRLAPGLTPLINRQVGVVGDGVPFCASVQKPRMAMHRYDLRSRALKRLGALESVRAKKPAALDVPRKAPDDTCDDVSCDPDNMQCCDTCYEPPSRSWSSASSSLDAAREEAEMTAAEVERMLVPQIPRIACGIVMEPVSEVRMRAVRGDDSTLATCGDGDSDVRSPVPRAIGSGGGGACGGGAGEMSSSSSADSGAGRCIIGNLLDAVAHARDASSFTLSSYDDDDDDDDDDADDASAITPSDVGGLRLVALPSPPPPARPWDGDGDRDGEGGAALGAATASSEKLLRVTELNVPRVQQQTAATQTYVAGTRQQSPDELQRKLRHKLRKSAEQKYSSLANASHTSRISVDFGPILACGDHGEGTRGMRAQKSVKTPTTPNTSALSRMKSLTRPHLLPALESLSAPPPSLETLRPPSAKSNTPSQTLPPSSEGPAKITEVTSKKNIPSPLTPPPPPPPLEDVIKKLSETAKAVATLTRKKPDRFAKCRESPDLLKSTMSAISENLTTTQQSATSEVQDSSKRVRSQKEARKTTDALSRFIEDSRGKAARLAQITDDHSVNKTTRSEPRTLERNPKTGPPKSGGLFRRNTAVTNRDASWFVESGDVTPSNSMPFSTFEETSATVTLTPIFHPATSCYVAFEETDKQPNAPKKDEDSDDEDDDDDQLSGYSLPYSIGPAPLNPQSAQLTPLTGRRSLGPAQARSQTPASAQTPAPPLPAQTPASYRRCEALKWARGEQLHPHCPFIAFPNDAEQRSLRPWPSNRLTRSIFTGAPRYVAPQDLEEALSPEELLARKAFEDMWRREFRGQAERLREARHAAAADNFTLPDYDVADPTLYNLLRFRPCIMPLAGCGQEQLSPESRTDFLHALVPLTPKQLIHVRLAPTQVDYGTVGVGSRVSTKVRVHNDNALPVKVNIGSPVVCVSVVGDGVVYVHPHDAAELEIVFQPTTLGRFNGMLRYVVNDSHVFDAPVSGNVVLPSLQLMEKAVSFGYLRGFEEAFPRVINVVSIHNPLQVPCNFEWMALDRTCYDVVPRKGEVPAMGDRACEVTYRANLEAQVADASLLLASESENYLQLSCHLVAPQTTHAGFVHQLQALPDLSLLRRRVFCLYLFNSSYLEELYRVEDPRPGSLCVRGDTFADVDAFRDRDDDADGSARSQSGRIMWYVRPARGTMRPRSIKRLHMVVRALAPGPIKFQLRIAIGPEAHAPPTSQGDATAAALQTGRPRAQQTLFTDISAFVAYPVVTVRPTELCFRRVPAGAQVVEPLWLQNTGNVEATVRVANAEEFSSQGGEWAISTSAVRLLPLRRPLLLKPRSAPVQLFLHFHPVDLSSYDFLVPFRINGGIGPPLLDSHKTQRADYYVPGSPDFSSMLPPPKLPCLHVEATVARRLIYLSATEMNFFYNPSSPKTWVLNQNLEIVNPQKEIVDVWIPLSVFRDTSFSIRPNAGATMTLGASRTMASEVAKGALRMQLTQLPCGLLPKESVMSCLDDRVSLVSKSSDMGALRTPDEEDDDDEPMLAVMLGMNESSPFEIKYEPREPGEAHLSVPVFACRRGWRKRPLLQLQLHGDFEGPSLTAKPDEVYLPPRSLNIPAEVSIWLEARNFEQETTIEWKCVDMQSENGDPVPKDCLQVVMFEKRVPAGPGATGLSVNVVFKSARPLGLRARIELSAASANFSAQCTVKVTAIADNSELTTYSYLRSRSLPFAPPPPPHTRAGATWFARPFRSARKSRVGRDEKTDSDSAEDDDDDDWPEASKSRKTASPPASLANESSFLSAMTAEALSEAQAVLMEVTNAVVAEHEWVGRPSARDSDAPRSSKAMSCVPVRRHRGNSRCSVAVATVDADADSLISSESSEDEMLALAYVSQRTHSTDSVSEVDEGYSFLPVFPDKKDFSQYAQHLRRVKQAIEEWTYDVAYRRHYFANMPSGMNECYKLIQGENRPENGRMSESSKTARKARLRKESPSACPFDENTPLFAVKNLAGDEVYDMLRGRSSEDTESNDSSSASKRELNLWEITQQAMRRYTLLLTLMRANGAVLPHVQPQDLVDYKRYELLFKEETLGCCSVNGSQSSDTTPMWSLSGPKLSERMHRARSVMAWIDVSLQLARIFWFPKIDEEHMHTQDDDRERRNSFSTRGGKDNRSRLYHVASAACHSEHELVLLAWLNDRFERARGTLCPRSPAPPHARLVSNFDRDLADSLVLAGVTLDLCPFLRDHLPDLYPEPATSEQAQHNAARLISAWRVIHLGFTVSLRDIVHPIGVKMLLLVAFLYSVMPSMAALHTLEMSAPLSTRGSTTVALVNPGKERLTYLAEFVGDIGSFFSVFTPNGRGACGGDSVGVVFGLAAGQRLNLQVVFHARTFRKQSCTLLITGNVHAPHFGRAVAFRLEGEPSALDVSTTLHVSSPLYKPSKRLLTLPLPYAIDPKATPPIEFDLYLQETEPDASQAFGGRTWAQQRTRKVLRRLFLNQSRMEAIPQLSPKAGKRENARGGAAAVKHSESKRPGSPHAFVAELSATVCAFTPRVCNYWIGCVSPTFGDFIVKIVSRPIMSGALATLPMPLPAEWGTAMCTCGGRLSVYEGMNTELLCPLITQVMVPCRNAALWAAVANMFEKTLGDAEKRFWKQYLDSNIGLRLMQWVLERGDDPIVKEYEYIFNSSATYHVSTNNSTVQGPSEFNIPDVFAEDSIPLMLHVDNLTPADLRMRLRLMSSDERELRVYQVEAQAPPGSSAQLPSTPFPSETTRKTTASTTTRATSRKLPKAQTPQSERK